MRSPLPSAERGLRAGARVLPLVSPPHGTQAVEEGEGGGGGGEVEEEGGEPTLVAILFLGSL